LAKHEIWELRQKQSLPLNVKIRMTEQRIRAWYDYFNGDVYVSFSGGKDSTVLLDIARQLYPDIEGVFIDTGLEYPEVREFVKLYENITWLKPKKTFRQVIEEYGYPLISKEVAEAVWGARRGWESMRTKLFGERVGKDGKPSPYNCSKWKYLFDAPFKISHKCCNVMKKDPAKAFERKTKKKPIVGVMATESRLRTQSWLRYGCNSFEGTRKQSNPMSFWTEQDVLNYLQLNELEIAKCYGDIIEDEKKEDLLKTTKCDRTGCMFCMFGCHLEKEPNRFQQMKITHPKQYDFCINKLGIGKVLDYIEVSY